MKSKKKPIKKTVQGSVVSAKKGKKRLSKLQKKAVAVQTNSKKVQSQNCEIHIGEQIWPLERDVLFRPDRMKYVRKLIKSEGCVFCRATAEKPSLDTLCVYKSKHSMVLLNKFPYNSGHLLVIPQGHCGSLLALSDEAFVDLQKTVRLSMQVLEKAYEPGGINVGLNHGAVAGAGIPDHIHYHVIPRWAGDLNFFPLIAETKVLVESLEQTYEKLWSIFNLYE